MLIGKLDVDEMFRNAWNEEIKSEIHVINQKEGKMVKGEVEEEDEDEKVDDEMDEIIDNLDESDISNMIMAHPLIYIWTIAFASFVTILSFFMFYR